MHLQVQLLANVDVGCQLYNGRFGTITGFGDPRALPPGVKLIGCSVGGTPLPIVEWDHGVATMVGEHRFQRCDFHPPHSGEYRSSTMPLYTHNVKFASVCLFTPTLTHSHTHTHSHTLLITGTCCYEQIKGTQDKDFSYSFSDSHSLHSPSSNPPSHVCGVTSDIRNRNGARAATSNQRTVGIWRLPLSIGHCTTIHKTIGECTAGTASCSVTRCALQATNTSRSDYFFGAARHPRTWVMWQLAGIR